MRINTYLDGIPCQLIIDGNLAYCADKRHRYPLTIRGINGLESPALAARYDARTPEEDSRIQKQARDHVRMLHGHCGAEIEHRGIGHDS